MDRVTHGLQSQNSVALEALQPTADAAPPDVQSRGDLRLAQTARLGQDHAGPPGDLGPRCLRKRLEAPAHLIAERANGLAAAPPISLRQRQTAQELTQT